MTNAGKHASAMSRRTRRDVLAVALAVVGGSLLVLGLQGDLGGAEAPAASRADPVRDAVTRPPTGSRSAEPAANAAKILPVGIDIPAIRVSADVMKLGLNRDETVEVPRDPAAVGWYSLGPTPGQPGSAVMLGHVDSKQGPAVFYRLRNLKPSDRVAVRLPGREIAHFEVVRVASYANEDFPSKKVYAGNRSRPALNLVTCGGEYDRAAGGYQSNVVVYTTYLWSSRSDA